MNYEMLDGIERQLAEAQGDLSIARDDLDLANDRIRALSEAIRAHLHGARDVESFVALYRALRETAVQDDVPPSGRYSVERHGSLGAAIIAERNDLRATLHSIQSWDCLNPPRADLLADLPWLRRLVDDALSHDPIMTGAPQDDVWESYLKSHQEVRSQSASNPAREVTTEANLSAEEAHAQAWKRDNTWNLSYEDFLGYVSQRGAQGKGAPDGSEDRPDDVVYTSPAGGALTRAGARHWCAVWESYLARLKREKSGV